MTAPLWTSANAATITGGRTTTEWEAHGVSIDSRAVEKNDLFVAIDGPNFDGHDFISGAMEAGAAAAIISRHPEGLPKTAPLLVVANTMDALRALAVSARTRTTARIIAVTGSVGKTGTKDSLHSALAQLYWRLGENETARRHGEMALQLKDKASTGVSLKLPDDAPPFRSDRPERNIISFSLWGTAAKYIEGALANARLAPEIYPEWRCRFHCGPSVTEDVRTELVSLGSEVVLMPKHQVHE